MQLIEQYQKIRFVHSLHSYFLEAGNLAIPIDYNVTEVRNGGSFSTRRVTANQKDKTIFILAASFHKQEEGFEHQAEMNTDHKTTRRIIKLDDMIEQFGDFIPKNLKHFLSIERPIDFKPVRIPNPLEPRKLTTKRRNLV